MTCDWSGGRQSTVESREWRKGVGAVCEGGLRCRLGWSEDFNAEVTEGAEKSRDPEIKGD